MQNTQIALNLFLADHTINPSLRVVMQSIAQASIEIALLIENGAINDSHGENIYGKLTSENVQGETQATLDVLSDKIFTTHLAATCLVAGMVSEEVDAPITVEKKATQTSFLVIFDPLDGSSNVDVNVSIGSIFSVLAAPDKAKLEGADYLIAGNQQLAAGYAIYGPCTMLVITTGNGTHGFTLNREVKEFFLTHPDIVVPEDTKEYAINASNQRFWLPPIISYIEQCQLGTMGERKKDFNMRWIASMVADVHRILMRGGVYLYPADTKDLSKPGRLRLMYEANPMAMLVEQAGGAASTGSMRMLDVLPQHIHQRIPVIIGSKNEVAHIQNCYSNYYKNETA